MGLFGTESRWIGRRFLGVILAAAVAALEISQLHVLLGVEAQFTVPPGVQVPPGFAVPPGLAVPPGFAVPPGAAVPPGLTAPPGLGPGLQGPMDQLLDTLNSRTTTIINEMGAENKDCFVPSDTDTLFDAYKMTDVVEQCVVHTTQDQFSRSICDKAEISAYFSNIWQITDGPGVPPNRNCNGTTWPMPCYAGWAAAISENVTVPETNSSTDIPSRLLNPHKCCAGFFCPPGLTCMIPCPLGAYCPMAVYNRNNSNCSPYNYSSRRGEDDCGGADTWVVYKDTPAVFCSAGQYCPDAARTHDCEKGHFCRVGSSAQAKCSKLGRCQKLGQEEENIKTHGILIIVLLSIALLAIYTCFDRFTRVRERRKSRARDIAAKEAMESVSAEQRWKRAKEAAKNAGKKAVMISGELGRKLGRTRCHASPISSVSPGRCLEERPPSRARDSSANPGILSGDQAAEGLGKGDHVLDVNNDPSSGVLEASHDAWAPDLYPENAPRSVDLYEAETLPQVFAELFHKGEEFPTGKGTEELRGSWKVLNHTRSQIYKYAYGQIEKEKVKQQQSRANAVEEVESEGFHEELKGPARFKLDISFVDLSLVLKSNGRKILSNVTGKLSSSSLTAVLGHSGAGKTTFLNALAGKETGSVITGQVFINGVPGSIQAYKRIIGFVPQDDIVHGTLTVEENLSFSAKYRLPVDTPRQERVLVVERIINRLNLTYVRDSVVGTVENRGISGGQRKRVNVGLELVIEPSLLLLDEPTSGLDSTSSRLVVQSLRREALLGVTVCFVVHQPSYGLFRMFDDVMLLAKGGYTVYLGPVTEIEAYFSSIGFKVPARLNPPDYYMDVLEGEAVPDNDPPTELRSLPVLWMAHNGYNIPLELQETSDRRMERNDSSRVSIKSFFSKFWSRLKTWVLMRWDILKVVFSTVNNLSGRQTPGFFAQYILITERVTKQRFRESKLVAQDFIILLLAGICLGFLSGWKDTELGGDAYIYTIITVSLLIMIAALRTFTVDKLQFWRESSSGVNKLAYFLAKDTLDHFNTLLKPAVYLAMFYFYNSPRSTFSSNYIITLALTYCCTGLAYIVAIVLKPLPAQLMCVFVPVLATLVVTKHQTGAMNFIERRSFAFWALQGYTIANAERYSGVWIITRCAAMRKFGYRIDNFNRCVAILVGYGAGARIVAFICLVFFHRKRQK